VRPVTSDSHKYVIEIFEIVGVQLYLFLVRHTGWNWFSLQRDAYKYAKNNGFNCMVRKTFAGI